MRKLRGGIKSGLIWGDEDDDEEEDEKKMGQTKDGC
jgi:hypothetical protein